MRIRCLNFIIPFAGLAGSVHLLVALLVATGCTTVVHTDGMSSMQQTNVQVATAKPKPNPSAAPRLQQDDPADPCKMRLQDMITPLFFYYAQNQRLPDKLEELRPLAEVGVELNFTCPTSGQPYVYNPVGLQARGGSNLPPLILYDATPAHDGHRHGVVAGEARNKRNQVFFQAFVVDLTEQLFQSYGPLPPPAAQPAEAPIGGGAPGDASNLSAGSDRNETPQAPGQGVEIPAGRP